MIQTAKAITPTSGITTRAAIVAMTVSAIANELRMSDSHRVMNSTNNRPLSNSPIH